MATILNLTVSLTVAFGVSLAGCFAAEAAGASLEVVKQVGSVVVVVLFLVAFNLVQK